MFHRGSSYVPLPSTEVPHTPYSSCKCILSHFSRGTTEGGPCTIRILLYHSLVLDKRIRIRSQSNLRLWNSECHRNQNTKQEPAQGICRWQHGSCLKPANRGVGNHRSHNNKYYIFCLCSDEENPIQLWPTMIPTSPRTMAVLHPMPTETTTTAAALITTTAIKMVTLVPAKR